MTEKEVEGQLGEPTKTEMSTCGQSLGQPWQCKQYVYGAGFSSLRVTFQNLLEISGASTHGRFGKGVSQLEYLRRAGRIGRLVISRNIFWIDVVRSCNVFFFNLNGSRLPLRVLCTEPQQRFAELSQIKSGMIECLLGGQSK
jgi:hypothetical protein